MHKYVCYFLALTSLLLLEGLWALEWRWTIFLSQSIGIDETKYISVKFVFLASKLWAPVFRGLWAKWAWLISVTNLRCVRSKGILILNTNALSEMLSPNFLAIIVSDISAVMHMDRPTDGHGYIDSASDPD